jgi:tripeptide aminopeptidase
MSSISHHDLESRVTRLLGEIVGIPSMSGDEDTLREFVAERLSSLNITTEVDPAGNLVASVPGAGEPLLLNAHLDRVPPGRANVPRIEAGRMSSDGITNLGADDGAGLAIILLAVEELVRRDLPHPPLVLLFTVGEEVGLRGAAAFDPAPWHVRQGIIFDNAGAAGSVVTRASSYIAFDVVLHGSSGHPGKDLAGTVSAVDLFRTVDLPLGEWGDGTSRVSVGTIQGGTARNAIPADLRVSGEIRTLAEGRQLDALLADVQRRFTDGAARLGGTAACTFDPHGRGYTIPPDEPLLLAWRTAWRSTGHADAPAITTFVGSDANALRQRMGILTVSTGVEDEHTTRESVLLSPLADLVAATLHLFGQLVDVDPARTPSQEAHP